MRHIKGFDLLSLSFLTHIIHSSGIELQEKGQSGSCGSLNDFLASRNGSDFKDLNDSDNLDNFPSSNYKIMYKSKGENLGGKYWRTRGWVYCQRVSNQASVASDRTAYLNVYKKLPKSERRGRFMCVEGQWKANWREWKAIANNQDWGIMKCPDASIPGDWTNLYLPRIERNNIFDTVTILPSWQLSFGIYLHSKDIIGWNSVLHFSRKPEDVINHGNYLRYPGIFFKSESFIMQVAYSKGCSNHTGFVQYTNNIDLGWEVGEYHDVKLMAERDANYDENDLTHLSLFVDGILFTNWTWDQMCYGIESAVYVADPWYPAADVSVVGLKYGGL